MIIAGLDLSLAKTGAALIHTREFEYTTRTMKPPSKVMTAAGHVRFAWILGEIEQWTADADAVAVEGPAYHAPAGGQRGHHERAGLWWAVTHRLWTRGVPTVVIPPDSLKLYAVGKGGVDKDAVILATGREFERFQGDNNAADALWLAQMTADHYGQGVIPVTQKARRAALDPIPWPVIG